MAGAIIVWEQVSEQVTLAVVIQDLRYKFQEKVFTTKLTKSTKEKKIKNRGEKIEDRSYSAILYPLSSILNLLLFVLFVPFVVLFS